jgi:putative endonuclease
LASSNGRALYIGVTTDLGRAIVREKQLKKWRREKKVELIDSANPEWRDISGDIF